MIALQDEHGLVFWRERDIATLTPEFRNRWQAVMRDGSVAFRPTPPPPGPWVSLGPSLVMPDLLERVGDHWRDPAGFLHPYEELPAATPAPEPLPDVPGVPCRRDEIYALTLEEDQVVWHTDVGDFVSPDQNLAEAAGRMPELLAFAVTRCFVHPERLRRLNALHSELQIELVMDNGVRYRRSWPAPKELLSRLGLVRPAALEPLLPTLWGQLQLRDWPFDLTKASEDVLRANFPTSRRLIANAIWQQFRWRQLGVPQELATTHRDLWYKLVPILFRAGYLKRAPLAVEPHSKSAFFESIQKILAVLIQAGLLTYGELGFVDLHPDWRQIGARRPEVVLLVEKQSVAPYARRLVEEFGVSLMIVEGNAQLIAAEHFRDAYVKVTRAPIVLIAYVDYDPAGWVAGRATADMLRFYGLEVPGAVRFMITGDVFTAEEKELYAQELSAKTQTIRTMNRRWVEETGGVDGKAMGIHSNHVEPFERVRELFRRALEPPQA